MLLMSVFMCFTFIVLLLLLIWGIFSRNTLLSSLALLFGVLMLNMYLSYNNETLLLYFVLLVQASGVIVVITLFSVLDLSEEKVHFGGLLGFSLLPRLLFMLMAYLVYLTYTQLVIMSGLHLLATESQGFVTNMMEAFSELELPMWWCLLTSLIVMLMSINFFLNMSPALRNHTMQMLPLC